MVFSRLIPFVFFPLLPGCIVLQHRRSIVDLGRLAGPLTDSDLVGRLLLIAGCFGLAGGVVAWITARSFTGWRATRRARVVSTPAGSLPPTARHKAGSYRVERSTISSSDTDAA